MKRKVIQLAGRTLVVSLPSEWAKKYHIEKGDDIEVIESGKSITYATSTNKEEGKIALHLKGEPEFMKRRINVAYKRGFDELELSYDDGKTIKLIQIELSTLVGFEITHHGKNSCIVKNIAETLESEFDTILRRVFLMLLELAENSYEAVKKKEYSKLAEIRLAEETNDKFTNLLKRILNKRGPRDPKTGNLLYCIVWELEKIADQYEKMCNALEHMPATFALRKGTLRLYQDVNSFLRLFYELFYKFSEEEGSRFTAMKKELEDKAKALLGSAPQSEIILLHYLDILIMRIHEIAGPYYGMVL